MSNIIKTKSNKITIRITDKSKNIIDKKIKAYEKKNPSLKTNTSRIIEDCILLAENC
jgi:hypothetical protein